MPGLQAAGWRMNWGFGFLDRGWRLDNAVEFFHTVVFFSSAGYGYKMPDPSLQMEVTHLRRLTWLYAAHAVWLCLGCHFSVWMISEVDVLDQSR